MVQEAAAGRNADHRRATGVRTYIYIGKRDGAREKPRLDEATLPFVMCHPSPVTGVPSHLFLALCRPRGGGGRLASWLSQARSNRFPPWREGHPFPGIPVASDSEQSAHNAAGHLALRSIIVAAVAAITIVDTDAHVTIAPTVTIAVA